MTPNHLELKSADGTKLNLEALYQIAPSCFTEVKDEKTGELRHVVNFTTLRQLLGDDAVEDANEMYQFTWPGKQEARREAARPISDTLRPCPEESVDWDTTQNLYIEGDNLAVLKLLQKGYMGKVKMIYIDPPYNTGNDFVYHDDFAVSQKEMDLFSGDVDEEGNRYRKNTDSNGRFHSDWCSMIYSRLSIARSLLREDGTVFISIDENEVGNLKKICNEVFGENNLLNEIIWQKRKGGGNDSKYIATDHEYVLIYAKNASSLPEQWRVAYDEEYLTRYNKEDEHGRYYTDTLSRPGLKNPIIYDVVCPDGSIIKNGTWQCSKATFDEELANGNIDFVKNRNGGYTVVHKIRIPKEGRVLRSIFTEVSNKNAADEMEILFGNKKAFSNPKPVGLIKTLIQLCDKESNDSIVLDFFSGSATTAHAVMELNLEDSTHRKFICIQLPESTPKDSEARKLGFSTIPEIAKERMRLAGKRIKEDAGLLADNLDTGFRVLKLDDSNFNEVYFTPKEFTQDLLSGLESNIKEDRTDLDLLFGAMLDWGVQLSLPMSKETVDGCDIYTVNEGDLVACFSENVTENVVAAMASKMPLRVLFCDSCFSEDKAKINVFELFKQKLDWGEDEAIKNIRVI